MQNLMAGISRRQALGDRDDICPCLQLVEGPEIPDLTRDPRGEACQQEKCGGDERTHLRLSYSLLPRLPNTGFSGEGPSRRASPAPTHCWTALRLLPSSFRAHAASSGCRGPARATASTSTLGLGRGMAMATAGGGSRPPPRRNCSSAIRSSSIARRACP